MREIIYIHLANINFDHSPGIPGDAILTVACGGSPKDLATEDPSEVTCVKCKGLVAQKEAA